MNCILTNLHRIMTMNEQVEILDKALENMCESLISYGSDEILNLLVRFSSQDRIMNALLVMYPTIVAIGRMFGNKPVYEIDERTLNKSVDANPYIWTRTEIPKQTDNQAFVPHVPKKGKTPKSRKRKASSPVTCCEKAGID